MALHANQGPRLGLPQMIQSRAQFGSLGVTFPLLVAVFIYLGYNVFQFIFSAEAIQVVAPGGTEPLDRGLRRAGDGTVPGRARPAARLPALVQLHHLRDLRDPLGSWSCTTSWPGTRRRRCTGSPSPRSSSSSPRPPATRSATRSTSPTTPATCPRTTPARKVIGWTFWGGFVGATWPGWLGVIIGSYTTATDPVVALHSVGNVLFSGFGVIVVLGTLPALVGTSGVNSYGAMLCGATIVDGFRRIRPTAQRAADRRGAVRGGGRGCHHRAAVRLPEQLQHLPRHPGVPARPVERGQPGRLLPGPQGALQHRRHRRPARPVRAVGLAGHSPPTWSASWRWSLSCRSASTTARSPTRSAAPTSRSRSGSSWRAACTCG